MPQLRQNPVTLEWVVIAPERAKRPTDFARHPDPATGPGPDCPFCPDGSALSDRIADYETERIAVIKNRYPAFVETEAACSQRDYLPDGRFYRSLPALGGHDVIVVKDHAQQVFDFDQDTWREFFLVTKRRYQHWRDDCHTRYSMLIYNQGQASGASVYHPHGQLFASNIVPDRIELELSGATRYFDQRQKCVFCRLIDFEREAKIRVIAENRQFIAFTFYAARSPFEIWVLPKVHAAFFASASPEVLGDLAKILFEIFGRLNQTLNQPALNFFIHDLPTNSDRTTAYHWHLEIFPRLSLYGGYELGAGTVIDTFSPEDAARYLREISPPKERR